MSTVKDISKLLAGIPEGAWVALSNDEGRVVAYAAELQDAIHKAKELGEADPVVFRVPDSNGATLFL